MNNGLKLFSLALIFSITVCISLHVPAAKAVDQEGRVAIVNGTAISQEELNREMIPVNEQLEATGNDLSDSDMAFLKARVLEEKIIKYELLYQECQKEGVEISEEEINNRLEKEKSGFSSDEEFLQRLNELGMDEEYYTFQIKRTLSIQRLINQKFKPTITDNEARKYYNANSDEFNQEEQVRASHILISVDSGADQAEKDAAKKQIEDILKMARNGEDFASLAQKYSQCPSSSQGGDLDFFDKGEMVKPFENAAFSMEPGEVSDVVETDFGYHIIKVTDRRGPQTFEEAIDDIKKTIGKEKIADSYAEFYSDVRDKAEVEVFLDN